MEDAVETGAVYRVSSANAGFGAYSADYSFFMDGGRESRARSRQAVDENMRGIVAFCRRPFARLLPSFRRSTPTARAAGTSTRPPI